MFVFVIARAPSGNESLMTGVDVFMALAKALPSRADPSPMTDADRLRAAAGKPMTGGAASMPEGGLFDENATRAQDLWDMVATDRGLVPRDQLLSGDPRESSLAELVGACKP